MIILIWFVSYWKIKKLKKLMMKVIKRKRKKKPVINGAESSKRANSKRKTLTSALKHNKNNKIIHIFETLRLKCLIFLYFFIAEIFFRWFFSFFRNIFRHWRFQTGKKSKKNEKKWNLNLNFLFFTPVFRKTFSTIIIIRNFSFFNNCFGFSSNFSSWSNWNLWI